MNPKSTARKERKLRWETQGKVNAESLDILIVGAGLSGITAGCRLKMSCPDKSFLILEAREAIGGTWDLFRYPGIRSDSDMYTFGFAFEPWTGEESIADGAEIVEYIRTTATKYGVTRHIRYGTRVLAASWNSDSARWTVRVRQGEEEKLYECRFFWVCTGYFSYQGGYQPQLPEMENYGGLVVHPQDWPEELDWSGQKIVILGSGATAVTLLPKLAEKAAHVTLLQRSPGYVAEVPRTDPWVARLTSLLPSRLAGWVMRWKGILYQSFLFRLARRFPELMKRLLRKGLSVHLSPATIEAHFQPAYNPWEQRLCIDTDGEYLKALRTESAAIVTDQVVGFDGPTVKLASGNSLEADIFITATGLVVELFGRIAVEVDGRPVNPHDHLLYKGAMLSDIPNLIFSLGYTNMSWTLKCDLTARYVCRLLRFMEEKGYSVFQPRLDDPEVKPEQLIDFSSGYLQRALPILPRQGSKAPWKLHQSYLADLLQTGVAPLDDGVMSFR